MTSRSSVSYRDKASTRDKYEHVTISRIENQIDEFVEGIKLNPRNNYNSIRFVMAETNLDIAERNGIGVATQRQKLEELRKQHGKFLENPDE